MSFHDDDTVDEFESLSIDKLVVEHEVCSSGFEIAASTHRGRVRGSNQDHYLVTRRIRNEQVFASSLPNASDYTTEQHAWLMAVADGLGGQASGEVASRTAVRTILSFANALSSWIMLPNDGKIEQTLAERAQEYADAIQKELSSMAEADTNLSGMATTLTAIYVVGSKAFVINIGDSRCYLIQSESIRQITVDHTVAQGMLSSGVNMEIADRFCNVLTRTLSTNDDVVELDLFQIQLQEDDKLLLCSDGLTNMVSDEEILDLIQSSGSARHACEDLIYRALDKGGKDNITVVLACV